MPVFKCLMLKYLLLILSALPGKLFAGHMPVTDPCVPVITVTASENNVCIGTSVTFHTAIANNGTGGTYRWRMNKVDAPGVINNSVYSYSGFHNGDVVICEYTCHTSCGADTTVISNPVSVQVVNDVTPVVTIANDDALICEGEVT